MDRLACAVHAARAAASEADQAAAALAAHVTSEPTRTKHHNAWAQADEQLRAAQQQAGMRAGQLAGEANVAARGLPEDPAERDQMREHAAAALADVPQRRHDAAASDAAELGRARDQLDQLGNVPPAWFSAA